jgi:hypothetical protein
MAKLFEVMLQGTITISQLVQVSEHVVDAVIVFATPSAARLFGVEHPSALEGQFISQIHHPDDALVTRHYTLARLHGDWYPDPYPMRILRGPSREPIAVIKHVKQVLINGVLTWISTHTPFDYSQPFVMPVTPAMIERAGSAVERTLLGMAHVAYMDRILMAHRGSDASLRLAGLLQRSNVHGTYVPGQKNPFSLPPPPQADHRLEYQHTINSMLAKRVETLLRGQQRRRHYCCLKCGWPWYSKIDAPRPTKCPDCGDKHWDRPPIQDRGRTRW